jgi:hypothetical protein
MGTKKALSGCAKRKLKRQELEKAKQKLGAAYNQELLARPSREIPPSKLLRGLGQRAVPPQKRSEHQKCPGTLRDLGLIRRLWPILR